jgi:hypothetical protein
MSSPARGAAALPLLVRPGHAHRADDREDHEDPDGAVHPLYGIAADHEDRDGAEAEADRDALQQRAAIFLIGWRGWLARFREPRVGAVISLPTRSRNDATIASLYSGPSSACAAAAARISPGDNGASLMRTA